MLTHPDRTACERRLKGASGFSLIPVHGRGALSIVTVGCASPGDIMNNGKFWAPKDGSGVRKCLNEIDIIGEGRWPFVSWAQTRIGPRSTHAHEHRDSMRWNPPGRNEVCHSLDLPILLREVLGVEIKDADTGVGELLKVVLGHGRW
jgi:hypothetical protein